jgi:hypothetical protein
LVAVTIDPVVALKVPARVKLEATSSPLICACRELPWFAVRARVVERLFVPSKSCTAPAPVVEAAAMLTIRAVVPVTVMGATPVTEETGAVLELAAVSLPYASTVKVA